MAPAIVWALDSGIAREAMEQNWMTLRTLNALALGGGVGFERRLRA